MRQIDVLTSGYVSMDHIIKTVSYTHLDVYKRQVMELADSITVIKQGKVIGNVLKKDTSERELAQMMVGRDVVLTVDNKRDKAVGKEVVFGVSHLTTVNDYGKEVVSDLSFQVHKGEILGIAGVEGNGQSELVKLMTGLMESTKGTGLSTVN